MHIQCNFFSNFLGRGAAPQPLQTSCPSSWSFTQQRQRQKYLNARKYRGFHDLWKTNNGNVLRNSLIYTAQILYDTHRRVMWSL